MNTFLTIKQYPKFQISEQMKSLKHNKLKRYNMVTHNDDNNRIIVTMI